LNHFETKYGYFSESGDEYIIKTPKTPKPWINVLSNGNYGLVVSQTGGGFSWETHSEFNRITRWHQDLIQDNWGKYFYFKNNKTGDIWSPTWKPVKTELDSYKAIYGFGYTKFITEYKNITVELLIFIPMNDSLEIWDFNIINNSSETVDLSIFTYFEWVLGSSNDHHREFHKQFLETSFNKEVNGLIATKRLWDIPLGDRGHWNINYEYTGFISTNRKISSYEGDKEAFIGQYNSLENPHAVTSGKLTKSTGKFNDSIGSLKVDLKIEPNKAKKVDFYIGIKKTVSEIESSLQNFQKDNQIKAELEKVKDTWKNLLGTLEVNTPDKAMNLSVNMWFRYQAIAGRLWARTAYYQQSGAFGFRDQLQDSLVYLPIDAKLTENQIRLHAKHQFEDGSVLHWWHPISETGLKTEMTDDLLWLPFVISEYIAETSNYKILDIKEPFYNSKNKATLFNHSCLAIDKVLSRFSKRGLPLIGAGDWNDGLSAVGLDMKGESIWLAEFLYLVLNKFIQISNTYGKPEIAERYKTAADKLKVSFNRHAWDGEWFWRATKDSMEKLGSDSNTEGKIYLNPQTWSVISEIAPVAKQKVAMESVSNKLLKKNGALLLQPAYSKPDKHIGYLSRYAAGRRENGGVYSHAATWAIWAFAKIGENNLAFQAYKSLNPIYSGMKPDEYVAEPFVMPGNIDGPDSVNYGMGGWTWYTGSASWFQKVVIEWILGVQASEKGLIINPHIPPDWKKYSVKRTFRNTVYNIEFTVNSDSGKQVDFIEIDGNKLEGNVIPPSNKKECFVKVFLK